MEDEVPKKKKVFKFPKNLAACADRMFELTQKRRAVKKEMEAIEEEEKAYKAHIIENLPKSQASGVAGKLCRVTAIVKEIPQLKDSEAFYKYVKSKNRFDLLQRRLSDAAIKEMWEDGKEVPGVEKFNAVTLSVNKL